jgi:hypothetical protein
MTKAIKIPLNWWQHITIVGGPHREVGPGAGMFGVKMAAEINSDCLVDIPTQDYHVPDKYLLEKGLTKAVCLALCGMLCTWAAWEALVVPACSLPVCASRSA